MGQDREQEKARQTLEQDRAEIKQNSKAQLEQERENERRQPTPEIIRDKRLEGENRPAE